MKTSHFLAVMSALILVAPECGAAPRASDPTPVLDSRAYLDCFVGRQMKLNRQQVIDAQAELSRQARAYYPSVSANGSLGSHYIGTATSAPERLASVTVEQSILNLETLSRGRASEAGAKADRMAELASVYEAANVVAGLYFDAVLTRESLKVEQERASRAETSAELMKELRRLRTVDGSDLLAAQAEKAQADIRIQTLTSRLTGRLAGLRAQAGLRTDFAPGSLPASRKFPPGVARLEALLPKHSELLQHSLKGEQYNELESAARYEAWPTLALQGGFEKNFAPDPTLGQYSNDLFVLLKVSIPLYDRSRSSSERARLSGQATLQRDLLLQREALLRAQLTTLDADLKAVQANLQTTALKQKLAHQALQIAWTKLKLGRLSYVNYGLHEARYFDARLESIATESARDLLLTQIDLFERFSERASEAENASCKLPTL